MKITKRLAIHTGFGMTSMALPFLLGGFLQNKWLAVMGCFGALILMYYVPVNKHVSMSQLLLIDIICIVSFPLSALAATNTLLAILWIGVVAFCVQYILSNNFLIGPQAFFILMINGMLASLNHLDFNMRFSLVGYAIMGIFIASLLAILENTIFEKYPLTLKGIELRPSNLKSFFHSINYALFALIAYGIGYNLHLNNYYWVLVSAITVLQSENMAIARHRQFHYIVAGIIGCIFALVIYVFIHLAFLLALLSIIMMGLICLTMPSSYLIGNLFTTPIALILFKLVRPELGTNLILTRIIAILLGTTIGVIGVLCFDTIIKSKFMKKKHV